MTEAEIKGNTFLTIEAPSRARDIYLKKNVQDHSTGKLNTAVFPTNLNIEHIYTSRGTPKNVVKTTPKLEEQTELG